LFDGRQEACGDFVRMTFSAGTGAPNAPEPGLVIPGGCESVRPVRTGAMTPSHDSGPRGRRFKSCLPDSEGRDVSRETGASRPSPFQETPPRTTGAPKSVTSGAADAQDAAPPGGRASAEAIPEVDLPSAIPAFLEACGKLAGEAAARGDLQHAREILKRAVGAATVPTTQNLRQRRMRSRPTRRRWPRAGRVVDRSPTGGERRARRPSLYIWRHGARRVSPRSVRTPGMLTRLANGDLEVSVRPPLVYLDHWAIREISSAPTLRNHFLETFRTRGTLMFSVVNVLEMAKNSGDSYTRIRELLDAVEPCWLLSDPDPKTVQNRENRGLLPPESFLVPLEIFGIVFKNLPEGTLRLGTALEALQDDAFRERARVVLAPPSGSELRRRVQRARKQYQSGEGSLRRSPREARCGSAPRFFDS
jgi:hypothetical protein